MSDINNILLKFQKPISLLYW